MTYSFKNYAASAGTAGAPMPRKTLHFAKGDCLEVRFYTAESRQQVLQLWERLRPRSCIGIT